MTVILMEKVKTLPLGNFWQIYQQLRQPGCKFKYNLSIKYLYIWLGVI